MKAWRSGLDPRGLTSLGHLPVSLGASMPGIMVNGPLQQPWLEAKKAKDSGLRSGSAHQAGSLGCLECCPRVSEI